MVWPGRSSTDDSTTMVSLAKHELYNAFGVRTNLLIQTQGALRDPGLRNKTPSA